MLAAHGNKMKQLPRKKRTENNMLAFPGSVGNHPLQLRSVRLRRWNVSSTLLNHIDSNDKTPRSTGSMWNKIDFLEFSNVRCHPRHMGPHF